jgi:hypothetical protein
VQSSEIVSVIEIEDNDSERPDFMPAMIKTIDELVDAGKLFDSQKVSYPVHLVAIAANGACAVVHYMDGRDDHRALYLEEGNKWQLPIQMLLVDNGGTYSARRIVRARGS